MATLKDVAKRAGVSVSTASYSINNSSLISEKTKEKVRKVANEIGYRPNGLAKNLKEQKTNIIGLFLSGFTGPSLNDMVEGVQTEVMKNNYELVVCASVDSHRLLVESYVDGAIILNYHIEDQLLTSIVNEKTPFVVLDRKLDNPFIKNVLIPNEEGSRMIVDYLVSKEHSRIGYIAGANYSFDGEQRLNGFRKSLDETGLQFNEADLIRADFTEYSGYLGMKNYLQIASGKIPTAFVCGNDEMAIGAIHALQENHFRVPEDVAVIGFDDITLSRYVSPSLTTIKVPRKQWGIIAAQTLFQMLDKKYDFDPMPLPIELESRESG
ncbi:LacI family transcriptional regulator [Caldibacillus lycopersici]|uniref:LacI family transcriptional regulator n=1 Tax=Perspicuibacillus lycopersici TaxID=1325689 RepID=A0AAE3LPU6_9BACI|nr:LacI family DNA-binding transcriptional regulator [Perspicuibacillus lycopersici]MCU9612684.1 LacI family transcriptional regulator [Perspicuibacillus lycopersici]